MPVSTFHVCSEHMANASPRVAGLPAQGGRWAAWPCLTWQRGQLAAPRSPDTVGLCRSC